MWRKWGGDVDGDMNGDTNVSEKSMWLWKWSAAQTVTAEEN